MVADAQEEVFRTDELIAKATGLFLSVLDGLDKAACGSCLGWFFAINFGSFPKVGGNPLGQRRKIDTDLFQ